MNLHLISFFDININFTFFYIFFFSAGNFVGQPLYTNGKACSACPDGTRCTRTSRGLCTGTPRNPQKVEDVNIARKEQALPQDPCLLNALVGPCRGAFPRFYFDKNFKDCSMFLYGGKAQNLLFYLLLFLVSFNVFLK